MTQVFSSIVPASVTTKLKLDCPVQFTFKESNYSMIAKEIKNDSLFANVLNYIVETKTINNN